MDSVSEADPLTESIDIRAVSLLLANMIESWLDARSTSTTTREVAHERSSDTSTSREAGVCLRTAIDAGAGSPPPAKHGAPIRAARQGTDARMERSTDSHA